MRSHAAQSNQFDRHNAGTSSLFLSLLSLFLFYISLPFSFSLSPSLVFSLSLSFFVLSFERVGRECESTDIGTVSREARGVRERKKKREEEEIERYNGVMKERKNDKKTTGKRMK